MSQVNIYVEVPQETKFKLVPPDGGWGYFVVAAFIVFSLITAIPNTAFGLLYGEFLESIGDETTGTALSSGMFFTSQAFSGLITDLLLRKYSCRTVGFIGAFLYALGAFGLIFVNSLPHMLICFSIMQGLACGIMVAAIISSFNSYFSKKMNLMMGLAQSVLVLCVMLAPYVVEMTVKILGFRKSLCVLSALALVNFIAVSVLDPVDRHMKKVYVEDDQDSTASSEEVGKGKNRDEEDSITSSVPIIQDRSESKLIGLEDKIRSSLTNLGSRTISSMSLNKNKKKTEGLFDFRLFKDWKFLAVNIGLSCSFFADVSFIALTPALLGEIHFSSKEIAFMMTVFFGCDLGARILYSLISAFCHIRSKYVYLTGTVLSAIFRIVFDLNNSPIWRLSTLAILGFLRCFIQTTLMLVLAEEYKEIFPTAFSVSMIISGIVNLSLGLLASFLKYATGNNIYVCHLLTVAYMVCIVLWTIELVHTKYKTRRSSRSRI